MSLTVEEIKSSDDFSNIWSKINKNFNSILKFITDKSTKVGSQFFLVTKRNTTSFTLSAGHYLPNNIDVFLNGKRLIKDREYTETSDNSISLKIAPSINDIVYLVYRDKDTDSLLAVNDSVLLRSPSGTKYKLSIGDDGILTVTKQN